MSTIDHKLDPDQILRADGTTGSYWRALNAAFESLGHTPSTRDWNYAVATVIDCRANEDLDNDEADSIEEICEVAVDRWWRTHGYLKVDLRSTQAPVDGLATATNAPPTTWFDVDGVRIGVDDTNDIQDGDPLYVNGVEYAWQRMSDGRLGYVKVHQDSGCTSCGPGVSCRAGARVKAYEAMAASPPPDDRDPATMSPDELYVTVDGVQVLVNRRFGDDVIRVNGRDYVVKDLIRHHDDDDFYEMFIKGPEPVGTAPTSTPPPPTTVGRCYVCDRRGDLVGRVCAGCRR